MIVQSAMEPLDYMYSQSTLVNDRTPWSANCNFLTCHNSWMGYLAPDRPLIVNLNSGARTVQLFLFWEALVFLKIWLFSRPSHVSKCALTPDHCASTLWRVPCTQRPNSKVLVRVPWAVQSFGVTGLPFRDLLYTGHSCGRAPLLGDPTWVRSPFTGSPAHRCSSVGLVPLHRVTCLGLFPLCQHRLKHLTALLPFYNVYISVLFIVNLNKRQKDLFCNYWLSIASFYCHT